MYHKYKFVILLFFIAIIICFISIFIFKFLTKKPDINKQTLKSELKVENIPIFNINNSKLSKSQKSLIIKIRNSVINNIKQYSDEVITAKKQAGEDNLLNIKRISNDTSMQETKIILSGIREAIKRYQDKITTLMLNIKNKIELSNLDQNTQKWILIGLNSGHNFYQATTKGDLLVLDQIESAINILIKNPNNWSISNNQLTFSNSKIESEFTAKLSMISKIKHDQLALINKYNNDYQLMLNSLIETK